MAYMNLSIYLLTSLATIYAAAVSNLETTQLSLKCESDRRYKIFAFNHDNVIRSSIESSAQWADQVGLSHVYNTFLKNKTLENCIDVGANIGSLSLHMSDMGCKKVLAIEAIFDKVLQQTIDANNLTERIEVVKVAVTDNTSDVTLQLQNTNPGGSATAKRAKSWDEKGATVTVSGNTLRNVMAKSFPGGKSIDFVKMDIEGSEREVFNADMDLFLSGRIKSLLLEIHYSWDFDVHVKALAKAGFKFYDALRKRHINVEEANSISYGQYFVYKEEYLNAIPNKV